MKILPVFNVNGRVDMTKLTVAFHNFFGRASEREELEYMIWLFPDAIHVVE